MAAFLIQINAQLSIRTIKQSRKDFLMCRSLAIVLLNLVVLSGAAGLLSACNTTAGVGQDVSAAGLAVTNSTEKVKSGM
jgi:entericidin B